MKKNRKQNYSLINFLLYDPEEIMEIKDCNEEEIINFKIDRIEHVSKKIYRNYLFHLKESEYINIIRRFELMYKRTEILINEIKGNELKLSYKKNRLIHLKYIKESIVDFILD